MLLTHTSSIHKHICQRARIGSKQINTHHQCLTFVAPRPFRHPSTPLHATEEVDAAVDDVFEEEDEYGYCMPSDILVDNTSHDNLTVRGECGCQYQAQYLTKRSTTPPIHSSTVQPPTTGIASPSQRLPRPIPCNRMGSHGP